MSTYHLRARTPADCDTVVGRVPDAQALHLFTGPRMTWPLTSAQLSAMEGSDLSAWMLVEDGTETGLGYFDLTLECGVARIGRVLIDPLGANELRLNVAVCNEPAIRAYARAGFTEMPG